MAPHTKIVVPPSDAPADPRKRFVPDTRAHNHSEVRVARLRSHMRDVLERIRTTVRGAVTQAAEELKAEREAASPANPLIALGFLPETPVEPTDAIDVTRFDTPVVDIHTIGDSVYMLDEEAPFTQEQFDYLNALSVPPPVEFDSPAPQPRETAKQRKAREKAEAKAEKATAKKK